MKEKNNNLLKVNIGDKNTLVPYSPKDSVYLTFNQDSFYFKDITNTNKYEFYFKNISFASFITVGKKLWLILKMNNQELNFTCSKKDWESFAGKRFVMGLNEVLEVQFIEEYYEFIRKRTLLEKIFGK